MKKYHPQKSLSNNARSVVQGSLVSPLKELNVIQLILRLSGPGSGREGIPQGKKPISVSQRVCEIRLFRNYILFFTFCLHLCSSFKIFLTESERQHLTLPYLYYLNLQLYFPRFFYLRLFTVYSLHQIKHSYVYGSCSNNLTKVSTIVRLQIKHTLLTFRSRIHSSFCLFHLTFFKARFRSYLRYLQIPSSWVQMFRD